ncbi:MAG TPA: IS1595 family transposase [Methylomirabilota bacterium]|nr:IS1595 family transposase [Methylomirabilota bacterium]HEV8673290.1 IS1595 family transposase [Methylomirabilota bacterium]
MNSPKTLIDAIRYYADPDHCQAVMVEVRWPNGVACPTCGRLDVRYVATRRLWECREKHPRRQFSVKVGTIFEDSPLGLDKWLTAVWMIANCKNGVSSYEIARALGITQKSAWFMGHRIRAAMKTGSFRKMRGEVEVDETFIGGKARFMHREKRERTIKGTGSTGKTAVMGLLERHGPDGHSRVTTKVIPNIRKQTLAPEVRARVEPGSDVFTDALSSYDALDGDYAHQVIDHAEEYARGRVHTNGLENFWSLLKRAIKGTYVSVEPWHLFRYLDEQSFRYNGRGGHDGNRFMTVLRSVVGRRLTFKRLTGKVLAPAMG